MPDVDCLNELVRIMARLRSPKGCPWDQEQTHASLKSYLLEEAYELLEAIDQGDDTQICSELGDVLLQVVFHAQIAGEEGRFTLTEVAGAIVDKLVRRHPHVFADVEVSGAEQVVANWERIKLQERSGEEELPSALDGIPRQIPALLRAQRIQEKARGVGFDWNCAEDVMDKIEEELAELRSARGGAPPAAVEEEFGDLLFALVNGARFLGLSAEDSLRRAIEKFERRFRLLEADVVAAGLDVADLSPKEVDDIWEKVKATES